MNNIQITLCSAKLYTKKRGFIDEYYIIGHENSRWMYNTTSQWKK